MTDSEKNDILLIENYLSGQLDEKSHQEYEERYKIDPVFKKRADEYTTIIQGIQRQEALDLKNHLVNLENKSGSKKTFIYLGIAASISILLVAAWFLFQTPNTESVFEAYYTPYPNVEQPVVRGEKLEQNAYFLYESGQYKLALNEFRKNEDEASRFYLAQCLIQTEAFNEAAAILSEIADRNGKYQEPSAWYASLCYFRVNQFSQARKNLQNLQNSKDYGDRARSLLEEIPAKY